MVPFHFTQFRAGHFATRLVFLFLLLSGAGATAWAQRPYGIDVSDYQGTGINWTTAKTSGVAFAWAKATEGLTVNDASFTVNEVNAHAAGVLIGAYHFAHPELHTGLAGADQEAAHFWGVASNYIKSGSSYLQPMLDIESDLSGASPAYTKSTLSQWVNEWCQDIVSDAAAYGVTVKPVVYTYTSYATEWLDTTVTNWPLWMASYPSSPQPQTGAPASVSPWPTWAVWQYDDTNTTFSGVSSDCDVDVFNGTVAGLSSLAIGGLTTPYITAQPVNSRVVDAGGSVSFAATAGGTLPLSYQWTLNGLAIAGATNASLVLTNIQSAGGGNYALTVTNLTGRTTSTPVSLLVYPLQATVFADSFDSNTASAWIVNKSSGDVATTFSFDYSTLGIPSAPHSSGGTTRGLQLKANLTQGICAALSVSPTNQSFAGDYRLHFDAWINVNGPFPGGGASSTEFMTAGIGTSGTRTEWTTNTSADGYYFSADGDGGVSSSSTTFGDFAGYAGKTWQNAATGIYAASSLYDGGSRWAGRAGRAAGDLLPANGQFKFGFVWIGVARCDCLPAREHCGLVGGWHSHGNHLQCYLHGEQCVCRLLGSVRLGDGQHEPEFWPGRQCAGGGTGHSADPGQPAPVADNNDSAPAKTTPIAAVPIRIMTPTQAC